MISDRNLKIAYSQGEQQALGEICLLRRLPHQLDIEHLISLKRCFICLLLCFDTVKYQKCLVLQSGTREICISMADPCCSSRTFGAFAFFSHLRAILFEGLRWTKMRLRSILVYGLE